MWQKAKGKYHLLMGIEPEKAGEGRFLLTACDDQIQVRKKNQVAYVMRTEEMCKVCNGVWHIRFTSVEDARSYIRNQANLKILQRALELEDRKTMRQVLEYRIKHLSNTPGTCSRGYDMDV